MDDATHDELLRTAHILAIPSYHEGFADFRKRHLPPPGRLFLQVLKLAEKAGLAKLGHLALDGTEDQGERLQTHAMSTTA